MGGRDHRWPAFMAPALVSRGLISGESRPVSTDRSASPMISRSHCRHKPCAVELEPLGNEWLPHAPPYKVADNKLVEYRKPSILATKDIQNSKSKTPN